MILFIDLARVIAGPVLAWGAAYEVGLAIDAARWRWRTGV